MTNKIQQLIALSISALLLSACGSAPKRIDATGNEGIVSIDNVDFKDWQIAAEKGIRSLLESGTLNRNDNRKNIIMISSVKNSTTQHINTRILTDKIRQALLRSGKALTTTAISETGADDAASRQVRELANDPMFKQNTVQQSGTVIAPDMSLSGEIVQQQNSLGRREESYFFFHLSLTDLTTGLAVWEDNVEIVKQGKKPLLGW